MGTSKLAERSQAATESVNEQIIALWLVGKSSTTIASYRRSAQRFLEYLGKPLHLVSVAEVQGFAGYLAQQQLSLSSIGNIMSIVRSLLSFAHKCQITEQNVGALVDIPEAPDCLSEKILSEVEVQKMIILTTNERDRLILRLLYLTGLRVSELCALKWKDLMERNTGEGQVTVLGKGNKTRSILLPKSLWQELKQWRSDASSSEPVFRSRKSSSGGHLTRERVHQIVRAAAARASLEGNVSPHWLRHSHASHALERGAKIHLVAATLGHSSIAVTDRYLHVRPEDSSSLYLPS